MLSPSQLDRCTPAYALDYRIGAGWRSESETPQYTEGTFQHHDLHEGIKAGKNDLFWGSLTPEQHIEEFRKRNAR